MESMRDLRELLLKTYSAASNEERKSAEDALQMLQNQQDLALKLAEIILYEERGNTTSEADDVRASAATYIVKLIRDLTTRQETT